MPVKYKTAHKTIDRMTKREVMNYYHMKCQSLNELLKCFNDENTNPKLRQKVKNELVRRQKIGLIRLQMRNSEGVVSEFK